MAARTKGRLAPPPPAPPPRPTIRDRRPESIPSSVSPHYSLTFSTVTPMGKVMQYRGIGVTQLSAMANERFGVGNGLNQVRLSYYLNRRQPFREGHQAKIAELLGVKCEWLDDPEMPT